MYLPDECWECIFKIYLGHGGDHRYLQPLSVLSKQFLTVTDSFQLSLIVSNQTLPFLPRLLQRFTNLTTIDLKRFTGDRDALLTQISRFPLPVRTLNLSNHPTIPANGLGAFSQRITTLTSLVCSNIVYIRKSDLFLIANCFPLLEELDLSLPKYIDFYSLPKYIDFYDDFEINALSLALPRLRKVNLSRSYYINDVSLYHIIFAKTARFLKKLLYLTANT